MHFRCLYFIHYHLYYYYSVIVPTIKDCAQMERRILWKTGKLLEKKEKQSWVYFAWRSITKAPLTDFKYLKGLGIDQRDI